MHDAGSEDRPCSDLSPTFSILKYYSKPVEAYGVEAILHTF